jgi:hypothetical protein
MKTRKPIAVKAGVVSSDYVEILTGLKKIKSMIQRTCTDEKTTNTISILKLLLSI